MQSSDDPTETLAAAESWSTIHSAVDDARSTLYTAGSAAILLMWAALTSLGYFSQYAIETLAVDFAERRPWFPGPLWAGIGAVGMVGSMVIGRRANQSLAAGRAARSAGIRVLVYWLSVATVAGLLPGAAGLWNEVGAENIPRVLVGVIALGYVLFGIMHRPAIAVAGICLAAVFYIPSYFVGDAAPAVTGLATVALIPFAVAWMRKSRQW